MMRAGPWPFPPAPDHTARVRRETKSTDLEISNRARKELQELTLLEQKCRALKGRV